jgi:(2Fe-2S) ferredoxin
MPKILSLEELDRLKDELSAKRSQDASRGVTHVTIGMGSCGIAAGARVVLQALVAEIEACQAKNVEVSQTGCVGLCAREPILEVAVGGGPKVAYGNVDPAMVKRIVLEHVLAGKAVQEFVIDNTPFPTV